MRAALLDAWQRFGDVVRIRAGHITMYLIVHPDDVRRVLVDNRRNYGCGALMVEIERIIGTGLITSDGAQWQRQRSIIQPAFHQQPIAAMASMMTSAAAEVLADWKSAAVGRRTVDITAEMSRITLRVAGRTFFDSRNNASEEMMGAALPVLFAHAVGRMTSLLKLPESVPTPENRRFKKAIESIDRIVYQTIDERRRSTAPHHDLLALLMAARDEATGEGMSDQQLRTELMTLLVARYDTTAGTLAWLWCQLSRSPEMLSRLQAEVDEVLGGRTPTAADVPRLSYLRMVIQEVMRLRPTGWLFARSVVAEDRLSGYRIPVGSDVMISPYLIHRHPEFWKNPEGFDPSRFLPEQSVGRHPFAYMPFGGGPRRCIGAPFAMMEVQLVAAMVLQAYELHLAPGCEPEMECDFTMRPRSGCGMTVRARSPVTPSNTDAKVRPQQYPADA
jgi:cytochrome P450